MRYRIAIHQSEEGFSISVPGLPGCWSQGATDVEAVENIKDERKKQGHSAFCRWTDVDARLGFIGRFFHFFCVFIKIGVELFFSTRHSLESQN